MGLGKLGRLRVDQLTITGELGPAPDAYTHYSPVMIAALSKTAGRSSFDEGGSVRLGAPTSSAYFSASISSASRILETLSALSTRSGAATPQGIHPAKSPAGE